MEKYVNDEKEKENNDYFNSNYFGHLKCRFVCKSQGIYYQKGFYVSTTRSVYYGDISYRTF